jgi:hypothetical protein
MKLRLCLGLLLFIFVPTRSDAQEFGPSTKGQAEPKGGKGVTGKQLVTFASATSTGGATSSAKVGSMVSPEAVGGAQIAESALLYVPPAVSVCYHNECWLPTQTMNCALCVFIKVPLPPNAIVDLVNDVKCWTTAGKDDHPIAPMVHCTDDVGWSTFHPPTITHDAYNTYVETTYHNRSHDRIRAVKVVVSYTLRTAPEK